MADIKEKPLNELLSHDLVDIYVGPENTHWILHEKLLCYRSKFFQKIIYNESQTDSQKQTKTFGLPDEEDEPFRLFVGWLYSGWVKVPEEEKDLGDLFDLYLMGEKWQIAGLVKEVLETVRGFYRRTDTYPGLRRVQYIYANTDAESPMRRVLVNSVARMLALADGIPAHWDKALRKNGQLAVDIIKSIQDWRIDEANVPDAREKLGEKEMQKVEGIKKAEEGQEGKPKEVNNSNNNDKEDSQKEIKQEEEPEKEIKKEEQPMTNGVNGVDGHEEGHEEEH